MKIKIKNHVISVISDFQIVFQRLKHFPRIELDTNNVLIINKDLIEIKVDDYYLKIEKEISTTDIYPILNNIISYCINDEDNLYIHSVVVSKNNKGYLLLGDFGSGKSTLASMLVKEGYHINSTDQTWLYKDKMVLGSCFNKCNGEVSFIDEKDYLDIVKIDKILILKPSFDDSVLVEKVDNRDYYIKNIFKYCNWHYDMPLMTEYIKLIDTGKSILKFLNNLDIDLYTVRGNGYKIMEALNDREESSK